MNRLKSLLLSIYPKALFISIYGVSYTYVAYVEGWHLNENIRSFCETIDGFILNSMTPQQRADSLYRKGKRLIEQEKNLESLAYLKKVMDIIEYELDENHLLSSKCHLLIAQIYQAENRQDEAISRLKKALKNASNAQAQDLVLLANIGHYIGVSYRLKGNYLHAKQIFEDSLKHKKEILQENDISIAETYRELFIVNGLLHNHKEASNCINTAIEIINKNLWEKRVSQKLCYLYLTDLLKFCNHHKWLLSFQDTQQILSLENLIVSGRRDEYYNLFLFALGSSMFYIGEREKSLELYELSLRSMKKLYGEYHPKVQALYHDLYFTYIFYMIDTDRLKNILLKEK